MLLKVDGTFSGWDNNTIVKLTDGSVWKQSELHLEIMLAVNPDVELIKEPLGMKLKIKGSRRAVKVKRV